MEPLSVTVNEAAKILGVSRTFIYVSLINTGKLKTIKLGNRTLVTTASIRGLVESLCEAA